MCFGFIQQGNRFGPQGEFGPFIKDDWYSLSSNEVKFFLMNGYRNIERANKKNMILFFDKSEQMFL